MVGKVGSTCLDLVHRRRFVSGFFDLFKMVDTASNI
jgi:hypothetical protein